ncbi:MAG: glutathione S-transferase family protein [Deltaproteobacteria bacterium]|nr:glutathione S-transferase family protein [Deltaproteobacteria bacterium]
MSDDSVWRLFGQAGCGSAIVEAALLLADIPYEPIAIDLAVLRDRDRLAALNPLVEVPTAVLADGTVMTESAAMVLLIAERAPHAGLAPAPGHADRPRFLRWLTFLVAAIYPTFTFGDVPTRYVPDGDRLRAATDARAQDLWRHVEAACGAPYFLGETRSAIDLYLSVMTRWRPRRPWFAATCPRVHAAAIAIDREPRLAALWAGHFGA